MAVVIEALREAPWWGYVLFAYLVMRGFRVRRPRLLSPARMAVLPAILLFWGGWRLATQFPLSSLMLGAWVICMVGGTACGAVLALDSPIRADRERGLLWHPGDALFLGLIPLFLVVKYVFGYVFEADPQLLQSPVFYLTETAVSGLVTGTFLGRFGVALHQYRTVRSESLG